KGRRKVLNMLGKQERPCFQHQNPVGASLVNTEDVAGKDRTKAATTDNDEIERTRIGVKRCVRAAQGLIEAVANISSKYIYSEIGALWGRAGHSGGLLIPNEFDRCWMEGNVAGTTHRSLLNHLPGTLRAESQTDCALA